jgi:hypothetical protein
MELQDASIPPDGRNSFATAASEGEDDQSLYHVILTMTHLSKNPNNLVETLRVIGTYTKLPDAKAAAHRVLFEAGYERELFDIYKVKSVEACDSFFERAQPGVLLHAEASDGSNFEVSILTTTWHVFWEDTFRDDKFLPKELYYVIQTNILYDDDEWGLGKTHDIEGLFMSYDEAVEFAKEVLLDPHNGITKASYAQYEETNGNDTDCGYGVNVHVHAVQDNGENYLVSVVPSQQLESTRISEAAMRLR